VAGIKVLDFAYKPIPNACKAPEVFDPVPSLIAADWHMRNPHKNYGLLTSKALFRLVKIGWLTLADVARHFSPVEFAMLGEHNDLRDERRYPVRRAGARTHADGFAPRVYASQGGPRGQLGRPSGQQVLRL
jgi:hypothetical protein